jgi:O-methyltransferase involved in polyketide biosynthesis
VAKIRLTEEKETMLATLYGRALDARSATPVLGDEVAATLIERIDYDFDRMRVDPGRAATVAARARQLDRWTEQFLVRHPTATVLHLGAGLDARADRVAPGPDVRWYDVDHPEVIDLRHQLFPAVPGRYSIGVSLAGSDWLGEVPADRPTLVVAEGLTMYLTPEQGIALFRAVVDRFGSGQLVFDAFSRLGIRLQRINRQVQAAGATLHWGIDRHQELERAIPRLHCLDELGAFDAPDIARLPDRYRTMARLARLVPPLRRMARYLRYEY